MTYKNLTLISINGTLHIKADNLESGLCYIVMLSGEKHCIKEDFKNLVKIIHA